jgi:hypothetical protein
MIAFLESWFAELNFAISRPEPAAAAAATAEVWVNASLAALLFKRT